MSERKGTRARDGETIKSFRFGLLIIRYLISRISIRANDSANNWIHTDKLRSCRTSHSENVYTRVILVEYITRNIRYSVEYFIAIILVLIET